MLRPVPETTQCADAPHPTEPPVRQPSIEDEERIPAGTVAEESATGAGGLISIKGHPPFKWGGLMLEQ